MSIFEKPGTPPTRDSGILAVVNRHRIPARNTLLYVFAWDFLKAPENPGEGAEIAHAKESPSQRLPENRWTRRHRSEGICLRNSRVGFRLKQSTGYGSQAAPADRLLRLLLQQTSEGRQNDDGRRDSQGGRTRD